MRLIPITWLAVLCAAAPCLAHIGSPAVFYEGNAGPYQLRVMILPPEVVPGRAQINVRVHNGPAAKVTALPVRWDAGRKGAPPPDLARPVRGETNLYNTELWLMDPGAYSVFVDVEGALGNGTAIVPLNSLSSKRLEMPPWMAAAFLLCGLALVVLLAGIIGAAVREGTLAPSVVPTSRSGKKGILASGLAVLILALLLWRGKNWWGAVDAEFQAHRLYKPLEVPASMQSRPAGRFLTLAIEPLEQPWRDHTPLVADHGKLMHLFLVREPAMDAFAHLHPIQVANHRFEAALLDLPEGEYSIYADVTHESGFTQTLLSQARLPAPAAMENRSDPDDSVFIRPDPAVTIRFLGEKSIRARRETLLRFDALAADGKPALLEPYLGMWSHAVIRSVDGTVFTHLHPQGTISMAAQELFARRERGEDPRRPIDILCGRPERELVFPCAFPKGGTYRVWVQVKSSGRILTQAFDFNVEG